MAFKKDFVTEEDCQLFVACEASQVQDDPNLQGVNALVSIAAGVKPIMRYTIMIIGMKDASLFLFHKRASDLSLKSQGYLDEDVLILLRKMVKHGRRAISDKDAYVAKLVDAFMYGEEVNRKSGRNKDTCLPYKEKCYKNSKKPTSYE